MQNKPRFYFFVMFILVFLTPACRHQKLPDLVVDHVKIAPENPAAGTLIEFNTSILNIGEKIAPPTKTAIRIGAETEPRLFYIPALKPGAAYTIRRTETIKAAQHYEVTVYADFGNCLIEANEINNKKSRIFMIK